MARSYGLQPSYTDTQRRRRRATNETLLTALGALGVDVSGPEHAPARLLERATAQWSRPLEPVVVAWDGRLGGLAVRMPATLAEAPIAWTVTVEEGQALPREPAVRPVPDVIRDVEVGSRRFVERRLTPPVELPPGYHRLAIRFGGREAEALVVSAPSRAPAAAGRTWGVFGPLYAVRSRRDGGVGDLGDLERLVEWVRGLGGSVVATLPLLAGFLGTGGPSDPSPYSPASRLFWNELYLDLERIPGGADVGHPTVGHPTSLVDYERAYAVKRVALERVAAGMDGDRLAELERWARERADAIEYARFRVATERHRAAWMAWPAAERDDHRLPSDPLRERPHLCAQWLMDEQLAAARDAARPDAGLYFDLPLGVNPAGYDVWRHREAFALDASAGAPPDSFFPAGQDWGFPPLHPDRIRKQGYAYPIACIRALARHAGVLRVDHVMALHRLFWVPRGLDPEHGVYVRYHPDEQYAILSLEAHRTGTVVVGEDLGTVPSYVRHAMDRRGIYRSFVLQEELRTDPEAALRPPPPNALASLNTHDMPTFASFWRGLDIDERERRGWLDAAGAMREGERRARLREGVISSLRARGLIGRRGRVEDVEVLRGCLAYLAESESAMVTVNVEDLWLETRPQNVPGTTASDDEPNWRRRMSRTVEAFRRDADVVGTLAMVDRIRKGEDR